jgi:hypothetical protein
MLKRNLVAVVILGLAAGAAQAESAYDRLPDATMLPANVVQISPLVPTMGEHWADPATLPLGPIYCVHNGKIVCLEFMMSQEDYAGGKSWPVLAGIEGLPPVNHLNISFEAHGHEGFEVPHYDLHMYFLSPEDVAKIQP